MSEPIRFQATVCKVSTLADMGLRLTLDLPEDAVMQAAQLMECKRAGVVLEVECSLLINKEDQSAIREGQERKSIRATA